MDRLPVAEIQQREASRKATEKRCEELKLKRVADLTENDSDQRSIDRLRGEVDALAVKNELARKLVRRRDVSLVTARKLQEILKHYEQDARTEIQRSVNEILARVARKDYRLEIGDNVFTSGATESDNLAILGLAPFGHSEQRNHIVSTAIEHKAVLEPLEALQARGFEVTLVRPEASGAVTAEAVMGAVRPSTLLVSVMHVNNETGALQPIREISEAIAEHEAYLHVDAAQGFGKDLEPLRSRRIDFISVSSHKIYGPVGIGALITRRRDLKRPPLTPLTFGGGQERGLRPGTLPVPLIVGFGVAAELAERNVDTRSAVCADTRRAALEALLPLGIRLHSDSALTLPHVLNFSVEGVDSEALMVALKDLIAISNGSACTSQSYQPSHVLKAMGLPELAVSGAVRLSWSHLTPPVDWASVAATIRSLL